jgi:hypothetical protein
MGKAIMAGEKPTIELKNGEAYINGVLGKPFHKRFEKFTKDNPTVKTIVFETVPGSANDDWNIKTCILLHKNGMNTELKAYSEIASGGVDLFISGHKRTVTEGAKIGVHSWSDGRKDGLEYPKDSEEHKIFLDFFEEIKMDTSFYWYTLRAAPAESIHWMTKEEVELYNLQSK